MCYNKIYLISDHLSRTVGHNKDRWMCAVVSGSVIT